MLGVLVSVQVPLLSGRGLEERVKLLLCGVALFTQRRDERVFGHDCPFLGSSDGLRPRFQVAGLSRASGSWVASCAGLCCGCCGYAERRSLRAS